MSGGWRKNKKLTKIVIVIVLNKKENLGENVENGNYVMS